MKKTTTIQLIFAALFTALGVLLPMAFHSLGMSGSIFSPMHIPVLLCGFICGWKYGALVGLIVPFLSGTLTGMPPLYPVAVFMAAELATYGLVSGILSKKFNPFITLVVAMLCGRVALGIAQFILLGVIGNTFTFSAFLTGAFVTAFPGIILQLVLIPAIMYALKKSSILEKVNCAI